MVKCEFLQHVLCKTFTFEVFWGASKHPSEGTFLNASQSKPLLLSRVVKIAELSVANSSEQWFCLEGFMFLFMGIRPLPPAPSLFESCPCHLCCPSYNLPFWTQPV